MRSYPKKTNSSEKKFVSFRRKQKGKSNSNFMTKFNNLCQEMPGFKKPTKLNVRQDSFLIVRLDYTQVSRCHMVIFKP